MFNHFTKKQKDYFFTFITEFFVLITSILVYKFATQLLGNTAFSEYALSRRTLSFLQPILIVGLGVGIPRYIARYKSDEVKSGTYFISGLFIMICVLLISISILLILRKPVAFLLFGYSKYAYLIFPICLMLIGILLHSLTYSYYRGKIQMIPANLLQLINLGIVPIIAFSFSKNVTNVLANTGLIWTGISLIFLFFILIKIKIFKSELFIYAKELLSYSIQRTPGDLALAGLLAIPSFIAAHITNIEFAGYVAFSISLLNMGGAVFSPISLILLPEASQIISQNRFDFLKIQTMKIFKLTLFLTILGVLIFEFFANSILSIYLGNIANHELIFISRIVLIGSLGYTVYISLRSVLDAYYFKAINTKNILIAFIFYIAGTYITWLLHLNYIYTIYIFTVSFLLLGILTYIEIQKIFKKHNLIN